MIEYLHSTRAPTSYAVGVPYADEKFSPASVTPPANSVANSIAYISGTTSGVTLSSSSIVVGTNGSITSALFLDHAVAKKTVPTVISINANSANTTLDLSLANIFVVTQSADSTLDFINVPSGYWTNVKIVRVKDATANSYTLAINAPGGARFEGAMAPLWSTDPNAIDILDGWFGLQGVFYGRAVLSGFAIGGGPRMDYPGKTVKNTAASPTAVTTGALCAVASDGDLYGTDIIFNPTNGHITSETVLDNCTINCASGAIQAVSSVSGVLTLDLSTGNIFTFTQTEDTEVVITNGPSDKLAIVLILRTHDGSNNQYALTFTGANIDRPLAPTSTAGAVDLFGLALRESNSFVNGFYDFGVPV